ncbi:pentapeptide repeat-containing protein, partial [Nocardia xishanensis]
DGGARTGPPVALGDRVAQRVGPWRALRIPAGALDALGRARGATGCAVRLRTILRGATLRRTSLRGASLRGTPLRRSGTMRRLLTARITVGSALGATGTRAALRATRARTARRR